MFSLDSAVAVLTGGTESEKEKLQLFMDPQLALLSVESAELAGIATPDTNICILPDGEVTWNVEHLGWIKPVRTKEMVIEAEKNGSIAINAWVAGNTYTQIIKLESNKTVHDKGPHTYSCVVRKSENQKTWEVTLHLGIYEQLDWSKTPHESDSKTYAAAEACDVVFLRADGSIISTKRSALNINQRSGTISFVLPEKPHSVKITTFRSITQQEIQFPLDGGDAIRKIISPHIILN